MLPGHSASLNYWRNRRESWEMLLDRFASAGIAGLDLYVPWSVHEIEPGRYDFGESDPGRDLVALLGLASDRGMGVILRPGPAINAEMNNFGLPDRIVRDPAVQAHGPRGKAVFCPAPPIAFPVPSFGSEAYLAEVGRWFLALGEALGPLAGPGGPIRMVQVDNEASFFFRDAPFDQDYRPEVTRLWTAWLIEQGMDPRDPPVRRAAGRDGLATILAWVRFRQHLVVCALARMRADLEAAGFAGHTFTHNAPPSGLWLTVRPSRLEKAVDVVTTDIYASMSHTANLVDQVLALRGGRPEAFSAELGTGTVFFAPGIGTADNRFSTLVALAHGLTGFNLYMGAGRDRWIGGLVPEDRPDEGADLLHFYQRLIKLLASVNHTDMVQLAPAAVAVPDEYLDHGLASFPLPGASPTLLAALDLPVQEMLVQDTWELSACVQRDWHARLRAMEHLLEDSRVPHVLWDMSHPLPASTLVLAPTYEYMSRSSVGAILSHVSTGGRVVAGPFSPTIDERLLPLPEDTLDALRAARESGSLVIAADTDDPALTSAVRDAADDVAGRVPWEVRIRAPSLRILAQHARNGSVWLSWLVVTTSTAGQRAVLAARSGWSFVHVIALREGRSVGDFVNEPQDQRRDLVLDLTGRQVHLVIWRPVDVQ